MLTKLDEAKADLIARAAGAAGPAAVPPPAADVEAYLECYYRHIAPEDMVGRVPDDVAGAALSHLQFAADRPTGSAKLRVFTPTKDRNDWSGGHTVVEVVTDDMPFLVDSVSAALSQHGHPLTLIVHPILAVRRTLHGELHELLLEPEARQLPDVVVESWMHLEIDRVSDPEELKALERLLTDVLRDVRDAVEDWAKMREAALRIADELVSVPPPLPEPDVAEAWELLRWLVDDHFTFLGFREYALEGDEGEEVLGTVPGSGLGILRTDRTESSSFSKLPPEVRARARDREILVLTKANSRSTVHRPAYLDYVGVKKFDEQGNVIGERRFLGLYAASAYSESITRIPVLRRKAKAVIARSGVPAQSHSGKDLFQILETYPRDELFQISVDELEHIALAVMQLQERRQLRVFLRRDTYGRFVSAMIYLPRDRYNTNVRVALEDILRTTFHGDSVDYTARVSESVLARLHYVVHVAAGMPHVEADAAALEAQLARATRTWDDDFADALLAELGEEQTMPLLKRYADAFPEAYKEDFSAEVGVADLQRIVALDPAGDLAMNLYRPGGGDGPQEPRFKIYRAGPPMSLTEVLPVLQRMGVDVTDERPYEIDRADGTRMWIYDFGLRTRTGAAASTAVAVDELKVLFHDAFSAVWSGRAESDGFNALVMLGGLTWRQAVILRAYAKYLRQTGSTFSQEYVEQTLSSNVAIAKLLVQLFQTRFDPAFDGDRAAEAQRLSDEVLVALDAVTSLDQDRILRSVLGLVNATLRTSYYQRTADGAPKDYVAFKLNPHLIPELPQPRPRFEIWVYSPRVEGVHLRFGHVARGGLRWSDRREDFRTEVLGLVKAQAVKNAVIVPVGAKGGFFPKQLPDPTVDREAWLAEGVSAYRTFVSALLDITDNLVDSTVVPPADVVRHDGDDPYLVVAADKGTATFSDIANSIAKEFGFWLGDAFASGGSAGYDHKAMGITAKGAWESVKRHFRELGVDCQAEDFTAVGIGDMSGDVFGNGMLLSRHIHLVAAFDHRHIFLDPDPVAASSYEERARLFALPRSSWNDYDKSLISTGGGVYSRSAKSVPVSPEVRAVLGLTDDVASMTPPALMRAILQAPVDLFWNGGIGTYVKSSRESNADVGDKANDAIRIDGAALRAKVVGEGGNLGFTQLGRIEASEQGVRINTDAIDNSAGVDTSDHEVNIKILLDSVVRAGDLDEDGRNALLAQMTDEVATLVLRDNYEQNVLLGNARTQANSMLPVHKRFIRELERRGELDRALEFLPSDAEIDRRDAEGGGLTSPEFSVLVAYAKMTLVDDLSVTGLPDEPYYRAVLRSYFPREVVERFGDRLESHPLRREITTTVVVNDLVNRGGITFAYRASEEMGANPVEIVRAYTVAREVFGLEDFWRRVEGLDNRIPTQAQTALYLESRRLLDRTTRWILQNRRSLVDVEAEIAHFAQVRRLGPLIPDMLRGAEQDRLQRRASEYESRGVPLDIAIETAAHLDAFSLLDIVELANATGENPEDVGFVYFALSDRFDVDKMLTRITALPRDERVQALARMALRYDLYAALAGLTSNVLAMTPPTEKPEDRIHGWEEASAEGLARARTTLHEIMTGDVFDLASLSVALRVIRTLVTSAHTRV